MRYREIGTSGIMASVVGMGTWSAGGDGWWDKKIDDEQAARAIRAAVDNGVNLIDTAPGYGIGHAEEVVARAIEGVSRDKLVISTKCGIIWWGSQGGYMHSLDGRDYYRNLEPDSIRTEVEGSLRRMKIDYIDVLHTHWQSLPSFPTPIERTMEGLLRLKQEGKIRAIGVSNCSVPEMKEYMKAGKIDVNQPPYSLLTRGIEGEFADYCASSSISIFTYSPLEQGLLTGKIGMEYTPPKGTYRAEYLSWYKPENRIKVIRMLEGWGELTRKYACSISQLVIAWTVSQKGITHALCGARRKEHVLENVMAGDIVLLPDDLEKMRADAEGLGEPV